MFEELFRNLFSRGTTNKVKVSKSQYEEIKNQIFKNIANSGDRNPTEAAEQYMELNYEIEED